MSHKVSSGWASSCDLCEELLDKLTLDFVTFVLNAADFSQTLNSVWSSAFFIRFSDYLHPGIWLC